MKCVLIATGCLHALASTLAFAADSAMAPAVAAAGGREIANQYASWKVYGGGPDNIKYSSLREINRDNVKDLEVAWAFDTADAATPATRPSELEFNPIVVNDVLYAATPTLRIVALEASSGKLRWSFDPFAGRPAIEDRLRGITYWTDGRERRLYFGADTFLYGLNADTGQLVSSFGAGGKLDLREGLGREDLGIQMVALTSPPLAYKDLLIVGGLVDESVPASPGHIRAFDARTGKPRWIFHTIPYPGEVGHETWPPDAWKRSGGVNNWSGMSLDEKRGIVFVPTGSATYDFYGADRVGDNLFANTLLALDAGTGRRIWHFQIVHHDLWDRDLPAPPSLITVRRGGRAVDAVAQITKSGWVFVLDRQTGEPLFPVRERHVPASDVPGEVSSPTQPFVLTLEPFVRQSLTEDLLTRRTPAARRAVLEKFRTHRSGGQFIPPSIQGTIVFPGLDGGGEWGGASFDPETGLLYVNGNEMAWVVRVAPRVEAGNLISGATIYQSECAMCHGADRRGSPPQFPSLRVIDHSNRDAAITLITNGKGRMPSFARLGAESITAVADFLINGEEHEPTPLAGESSVASESPASDATPVRPRYLLQGYKKFLDPEGYPAVSPPWGTLSAIDVNTGQYRWRIPLGEYPELAAHGLKNTGSENYGGSVVTAGGLLIVAATVYDNKIRAFDKLTGKLLWEHELPAAGTATPAVYESGGRQFIVIATGSGKNPSGKPGSGYVAFALPRANSADRNR